MRFELYRCVRVSTRFESSSSEEWRPLDVDCVREELQLIPNGDDCSSNRVAFRVVDLLLIFLAKICAGRPTDWNPRPMCGLQGIKKTVQGSYCSVTSYKTVTSSLTRKLVYKWHVTNNTRLVDDKMAIIVSSSRMSGGLGLKKLAVSTCVNKCFRAVNVHVSFVFITVSSHVTNWNATLRRCRSLPYDVISQGEKGFHLQERLNL